MLTLTRRRVLLAYGRWTRPWVHNRENAAHAMMRHSIIDDRMRLMPVPIERPVTLPAGTGRMRSGTDICDEDVATGSAPQAGPARLQAELVTVELAQQLKPIPNTEGLAFGSVFSDHMLEVEWTKEGGWGMARIVPFHNIEMHPAAHALHYAVEIFEGMKAYSDDKRSGGRKNNQFASRLFRPIDNMIRMNLSASRMLLPTFDPAAMTDLIERFVEVEKRWVPRKYGHSLYLRPTLVSTHGQSLALGQTEKALFYCIATPVGPYFPDGFRPVKLLASTEYTRAHHGGTGAAKCGGNYGGTIKADVEARQQGCAAVLWLLGDDEQVTEAGTMNFFVLWRPYKGAALELVTPPLDGTILPGITRDTVMQLAERLLPTGVKVVERQFTVHDLIDAVDEGRLEEAFGTGTACIVCPIDGIRYEGRDVAIPTGLPVVAGGDQTCSSSKGAGPFTSVMMETILAIQHGRTEAPQKLGNWSVPVM